MTDDRLVNASPIDDDVQYEAGLRPRSLDEYIGQDRVREQLQVSIAAAKQRGEALDHVLLYGPPGLGKTTLAYVIGAEMGVPVKATAGPIIEKPGDLAGMLTDLQQHEVIFIDEIHRMPPAIEELHPHIGREVQTLIGPEQSPASEKAWIRELTHWKPGVARPWTLARCAGPGGAPGSGFPGTPAILRRRGAARR